MCKFGLSRRSRPAVAIRINNNNVNRNYNTAPSNTTINNNTYNTYNSTPVNNCYPSYSEEAPPPYSENINASYNNNNKSSDIYPLNPPTFPSTAYAPSAPSKY